MTAFRPLSVLTLLLASGCGYSQGGGGYTWGTTHRPDVRTVAVPIFQTRSFSVGDERTLTKAIVDQLESRTPYKVAPRERADTILEGTIVSVGLSTVSSDRTSSLPQEQLYTVVVDFTWKDLRSGRVLVERRGFEQSTAFYPTLGEGRFAGGQLVAEQLAGAIVEELQADW